MGTYLVGTDGLSASEAISDYLESQICKGDHLEVINVLTGDDVARSDPIEPPASSPRRDADETQAGKEALEVFEERFEETASVTTRQLHRGRSPTEELIYCANEVDADQLVTALRRHSRTERIIFGSVSHALLKKTTRPITLVPLKEYQAPTGQERT